MEPDQRDHRCHRPQVFDKMEELVREMIDQERGGVPIKSHKVFLTFIPETFVGFNLVEWLMERLDIEESETLNLANQLCQYGYFFPINERQSLSIKDDSSLYRFQAPYHWPFQNKPPDNVDYAIYLVKRTLRNRQKHGLEDYEMEALNNLRRNLANKWDIITAQAEEQVRLNKAMKKDDKLVRDSQEKAYWRIHRPPPGVSSSLEQPPVPTRCRNGGRLRKKTIEDWRREVELLKRGLFRTRIKVSQALDSMVQHVDTYAEYDPFLTPPQPPNPWASSSSRDSEGKSERKEGAEGATHGPSSSFSSEVPTERQVRKWALSMEDLVRDPIGVQEFTNYLRKEKSEENILFWLAVNDLRSCAQSQITSKIQEIYNEYVRLGSRSEVNIDNQTMDKVLEGIKQNSRYCFDAAQEHVYNLLLKKDCYPRFIRSDFYKNLLAAGVQPQQKKRFFNFGPVKKKISTSTTPNPQLLQQQQQPQSSQSTSGVVVCGALSKRRGSDRSLTGSTNELVVSGVKDNKVSHSQSQSNLSDIPYRVKKQTIVPGTSTSEEVCPWEASSSPPKTSPQHLRKNSTHIDSESSSSDISTATTEVTERVRVQRCLLTQQCTLDCGKTLAADTTNVPRRASVSVPINYNKTSNFKVSSFEDGAGSAILLTPHYSDSNREKTLINSPNVVKSTVSSAPKISVSSVVDEPELKNEKDQSDAVEKTEELEGSIKEPEQTLEAAAPSPSEGSSLACEQEPLAPLAEPDSESPGSEQPPFDIAEEEKGARDDKEEKENTQEEGDGEAKANDVCPWEDEDICRVESTTFVKTYSTLGYL